MTQQSRSPERKAQMVRAAGKCLKNRKILLIETAGGKCGMCGVTYNGTNAAIFDFHHRVPDGRSKERRFRGTSLESQLEELEKCDLLCANCHRLMHSEEY